MMIRLNEDNAEQVLAGLAEGMPQMPRPIFHMVQRRILRAIEAYPENTHGKQVLQQAVADCTPESLVSFVLGAMMLQQSGLPVDRSALRLLRDREGDAAFTDLCRSVAQQPQSEPKADIPRFQRGQHRRQFMKNLVAAAAGGTLLAEFLAGGFEWRGDPLPLPTNMPKVGRVLIEGAIGYLASASATDNKINAVVAGIIQEIEPLVDAQVRRSVPPAR